MIQAMFFWQGSDQDHHQGTPHSPLCLSSLQHPLRQSDVAAAVQATVESVGLTEKVNVRAAALSGGMKRKLSLSIAMIGGPRVLYLDEPTSGMDPWSRRSTWSMLQASRKGRITVLTTHFMEEADIMGDRIGIMGAGRLLCCGSPMYLKNKFGLIFIHTPYFISSIKKMRNTILCKHTCLAAPHYSS